MIQRFVSKMTFMAPCGLAVLLVAGVLCTLPATAQESGALPSLSPSEVQAPPVAEPAYVATDPATVPPSIDPESAPALDSNALPQLGEVSPRAPGMNLPPSAPTGAPNLNNPFEPVAAPVKTPEQIEAEIRSQAFNAAITGLLPMRPEEIRTLLERFDQTKQAVEVPVYPYPEPQVAVETVSLDPGVRPPEIHVAVGHVTTLSILDVTGEPWPIQDVSWAGNFEVVEPEEGGNIIRITPMSDFTYGNMSIRLLKLRIPVTFVLKTHRDQVHYRFDARIAKFGPMAQSPIMEGGMTLVAGSPVQASILDGVPPSGAERLEVTGVDGRTTAYKYNSQTFVRTPLTLLSPGWSNSVASADGMNVYTIENAPVLLLSDGGDVVRAKLSPRGADGMKQEDKAQ